MALKRSGSSAKRTGLSIEETTGGLAASLPAGLIRVRRWYQLQVDAAAPRASVERAAAHGGTGHLRI